VVQYTYCPKCDKDVEVIEVSLGTRGGDSKLRCSECGFVISDTTKDYSKQGTPTTRAAHPEEKAKLVRVVSAGYSNTQNESLISAIARNRYANAVDHCANGEEFLSKMTSLLHKKERPKLIILEVNMSIMNGINSALCLRSIEKGISDEKVPILFFTQKSLDDMFTRAIKFLTPAKYVPLPANPTPDVFQKRADQVVELLRMEKW